MYDLDSMVPVLAHAFLNDLVMTVKVTGLVTVTVMSLSCLSDQQVI